MDDFVKVPRTLLLEVLDEADGNLSHVEMSFSIRTPEENAFYENEQKKIDDLRVFVKKPESL